MIESLLTILGVFLAFYILSKKFPMEGLERKYSKEDLPVLRKKYSLTFLGLLGINFIVFIGGLLGFLFFAFSLNISPVIGLGIGCLCGLLIPHLGFGYLDKNRDQKWKEGFREFLDLSYGFNYFKVLGSLLKFLVFIGLGLIVYGLITTY